MAAMACISRLVAGIFAAVAWTCIALAAEPVDLRRATVLVMVEERGCPYCRRFDDETRASYVNSPEGRLAPLVRRARGSPELAFLDRLAYSPTFVLLVQGREVGRIVGYRGPDLFWMEMAGLFARSGLAVGAGG